MFHVVSYHFTLLAGSIYIYIYITSTFGDGCIVLLSHNLNTLKLSHMAIGSYPSSVLFFRR